jgi:S-DNA-T family DNA segregation ATPase FtsK/SpoIIIE
VLPLLVKVEAGECTDRLTVRLVSGQSPASFANQADSLAHGFRVLLCRVRTASPGMIILGWSAATRSPSR